MNDENENEECPATTEIAKEIRKDVKALVADGTLPKGTKVSTKTRYFAGGSSIDVTITDLPTTTPVYNPEYLVAEQENPHNYHGYAGITRHSVQVRSFLKAIEAVVDSYNFDGSDSQTDYFHVRFYGSVKLDWELERDRRVSELATAVDAVKVEREARELERVRTERDIAVAASIETFCNALHGLVKACEAHDNFEPDLSGLTSKTDISQISTGRKDVSHQYGCPASLTTATFEAHGLTHVARRFWRSDAPGTGKIELYTIEPGTLTETYFRDVNEFEPSKVDLKAITALISHDPTYVPSDAVGSWQRFAAIEIY